MTGRAVPVYRSMPYGNRNFGLIGSFVQQMKGKISLNNVLTLAVIHTRYEDEFPTDDGVKTRNNWLLSLTVGPTFTIQKVWQAGLNIAHTDNISNIPIYDFSRTINSLTISRVF